MNFLFRAFFLPWGIFLLLVLLLTFCGISLIRAGGQEKTQLLIQSTKVAKRDLQRRQVELVMYHPEVSADKRNERIYDELSTTMQDFTFGQNGGVACILRDQVPLFFGNGMISSPKNLKFGSVASWRNSFDDIEYLYYAESLQENEWHIISFIPKNELFDTQQRHERILLLFAGLAILLFSALSFRNARLVLADLHKLEKDISDELSGFGKTDVPACKFLDFENVKKHLFPGIRELRRKIDPSRSIDSNRSFDQRLESIGILAGGLAHDFNNLLTAIRGNIQLMLMTNHDPDRQQYLEDCDTASESAIQLINRLLTFSKGGAPVKLPVNLGDLIRRTVSFYLRGTDIKLNFDLAPQVIVSVDQMQFGQVLQNLTINAQQMMNGQGTFSVTLKHIEISKDQFSDIPAGYYAEIKCRDTGPGIPAEIMDKLFDPFFTTRRNGTGLGLSMCYAIVKRHSGFISAASLPEGGAEFTILLPAPELSGTRQNASASSQTHSSIPAITYAGGGHVLVMDDQASIRELLGHMLNIMNCTVAFAERGEDAIRIYLEALEKGTPFDVVILDLTIPSGSGGKETVSELLKIDPSVKAIAASGYSNDPVLSDYERYGFCGILPKPFRFAELNQLMLRFCRKT